jgi:hypothetical protein
MEHSGCAYFSVMLLLTPVCPLAPFPAVCPSRHQVETCPLEPGPPLEKVLKDHLDGLALILHMGD